MNEILAELEKGSTVLLELEKLQDFWDYCKTKKHLYAFHYEYPNDKFVKITISKDTIFIQFKLIID